MNEADLNFKRSLPDKLKHYRITGVAVVLVAAVGACRTSWARTSPPPLRPGRPDFRINWPRSALPSPET